ncbi:MAG: hypothetical protein JXR56_08220 [Candidatus Cloacimonetes bacterium]|nr:hypothetical protein [Candidatus Cloacimonadota bacterium]
MKLNITDEQIKDIAEILDTPMDCYYNLKTGEVLEIPSEEVLMFDESELWEEMFIEFSAIREDCVQFHKISSSESYQLMAKFADTVDDESFRIKLKTALEFAKPFKNFKKLIDHSDYREQWFEFKMEGKIEAVKRQIEALNEEM